MPTLKDFTKWPPWPLSNLIAYLSRLSEAFGARYVAAVILVYGINQGVGEALVYYVRRYYLLDSVGLTSKHVGQLLGFAGIPWQLKSLFGLLSDTVPISGLHRSPYMLLAGIVGVSATTLLTLLPPHAFGPEAYGLLFMAINLNFAMPDVMIDATVAERSKLRPELAAELQALCWGSINSISLPFAIAKGYLYTWVGAKFVFALCIGAAACVLVPPTLGWIEKRRPGHSGVRSNAVHVKQLCQSTWSHPMKRSVVGAAATVGCFSLALGLTNLLARDWPGLTVFSLVADLALCITLYLVLRRVDKALAGAAIYTFLARALCPTSMQIFEWSHDPGHGDNRCWTAYRCAAESALTAVHVNETLSNASKALWLLPNATSTLGDGVAAVGTGADGDELPCGWARARDYPCVDAIWQSWTSVFAKVALSLGVWAYVSFFQSWPFRRIFFLTQSLMCLTSFADVIWVQRINRDLGINDVAWMILGDEVAQDFVYKLNQLPFMIYAAKLCPPGVEASMFSLFMGLSNFGSYASEYLGSGLLQLFGEVRPPEYPHLTSFVATCCAMKALPLLLIPFLVPTGSPLGSAEEMGAGAAITGKGLLSEDGRHNRVGDASAELRDLTLVRASDDSPEDSVDGDVPARGARAHHALSTPSETAECGAANVRIERA